VLIGLGFDVQIVPNMDVEQGIHAARLLFPRCYFDKTRAAGLTAALKRYRRQQNQVTGSFGAPLHDDNSHPADAYRYLSIVADQLTNETWGGAPTLSAAKGSLYLRADGSSATTRMYVNTDGATGWTNVATAT
jgi:hypothetical protein